MPDQPREPLPDAIEAAIEQFAEGVFAYIEWQDAGPFWPEEKTGEQLRDEAKQALHQAIAAAILQTKVDEYESCAQAFLADVEKHQALRERAERLRVVAREAERHRDTSKRLNAQINGLMDGDLADDIIQWQPGEGEG